MNSLESDVIVIGGGNAAMCAALSARERGVKVTVLECAPPEFRGGNSRHTRNMRCMHPASTEMLTGAYPEEEYWCDLLRVTGGQTNEQLARLVIRAGPACAGWMRGHGVRFQPPLTSTLSLDRTNLFFLGGGKALLNTYYEAARECGIEVLYNAEVTALEISDRFEGGTVIMNGAPVDFHAKALVFSAGGFESNLRGNCCEFCSMRGPNPSATRRNVTLSPSTGAPPTSPAASLRGWTACRWGSR